MSNHLSNFGRPLFLLPWVKVNLLIRSIIGHQWDDATWPAMKQTLRPSLGEVSGIARGRGVRSLGVERPRAKARYRLERPGAGLSHLGLIPANHQTRAFLRAARVPRQRGGAHLLPRPAVERRQLGVWQYRSAVMSTASDSAVGLNMSSRSASLTGLPWPYG